jgi:hypothetical protein
VKKSNVGDDGANNFDPLDLGFDDGEACVPRRGRPNSPVLHRARAAYWAWTVQMTAAKSFAKLEREMALRAFPTRDGGGFAQPNAWLKYAKGQRSALPPSEGDKSPVVRTEARYPGTRAAYDSIVWDLMYDAQSRPMKRLRLTSRVSPYVLSLIKPKHIQEKDKYRILLTHEGIADLVFIRHLDAFGLLLMQWRNLDWERADVSLIYLARTWLLFSFQWMEPFVTCRRMLTKLIHQNVGELGLLNGPGGLDPNKTPDECVRDAFFSALFGGVVVNVPSLECPNL